MNFFYHIADPEAYREASSSGLYRHPSLLKEGFIHCSTREQLEATANLYYALENEIRVLKIEQSRVKAKVVFEEAKRGGLFPHIFGPLNFDSVVAELVLRKSGDGLFHFREDLMEN